jgi:hypothetical protein
VVKAVFGCVVCSGDAEQDGADEEVREVIAKALGTFDELVPVEGFVERCRGGFQ